MNKLPWTIKHMSATEQSLKSHCQVQDLCILATILCGHGGFSPDKMLEKWSGEGDRDHKVKVNVQDTISEDKYLQVCQIKVTNLHN